MLGSCLDPELCRAISKTNAYQERKTVLKALDLLRCHLRTHDLAMDRRTVAEYLIFECGWSTVKVAKAINRHHTTVSYYINHMPQ